MSQRSLLTLIVFIFAVSILTFVFRVERASWQSVVDEPQDEGPSLVEITIEGDSMAPTIHDGDVVIGDASQEALDNIGIGDIILFSEPETTESTEGYLVKRVVALEGDQVEIKNGTLLINKVFHDYGSFYPRDYGPYTVEAGGVFVIGDNAGASLDSRTFRNPTLPMKLILARVLLDD